MEKSNAALRLEKLREKQEKLKNRIRQEQSKINKLERKERARQLIQFGELIEIAGLFELDKEVLLGGLMELAATLNNNDYKKAEWKQIGDKILEEREAEKKARRKSELETSGEISNTEEIEAEELLDDTEEAIAATEETNERYY